MRAWDDELPEGAEERLARREAVPSEDGGRRPRDRREVGRTILNAAIVLPTSRPSRASSPGDRIDPPRFMMSLVLSIWRARRSDAPDGLVTAPVLWCRCRSRRLHEAVTGLSILCVTKGALIPSGFTL